MDYYELLSEFSGIDTEFLKRNKSTLKFSADVLVDYMQKLHEKLNGAIVNEANPIICPDCKSDDTTLLRHGWYFCERCKRRW